MRLLRYPVLGLGSQEREAGEAHIRREMTLMAISILLMLVNLSCVHWSVCSVRRSSRKFCGGKVRMGDQFR
jgi:hypothetical protein